MEYQMRNWYYYCWLSGDHIVEQAVHGIDTMAWATGDKPPIRCWGVGGRQSRTDAKYGNIWDHFSVVYEYPEQRPRLSPLPPLGPHAQPDQGLHPRLQGDGRRLRQRRITGENKWRYRSSKRKPDMYQVEHDEMFAAIRAGKPINNGEQAAHSTLLALMGRTAAYTGLVVTPGDDPQLEGRPEPAQVRVRPAGRARRSPCRATPSSPDQPEYRVRRVASRQAFITRNSHRLDTLRTSSPRSSAGAARPWRRDRRRSGRARRGRR